MTFHRRCGGHLLARRQLSLAVASVEQTLSVVALLVALAVHEHIPAADRRRAIPPRVTDAERAIAVVELTRGRVAFVVAFVIIRFLLAVVHNALLHFSLEFVVGIRTCRLKKKGESKR